MTAVTYRIVAIRCDQCDDEYEGHPRDHLPTVRNAARNWGWLVRDERRGYAFGDLCPNHAADQGGDRR